jgi:hypothetical protein
MNELKTPIAMLVFRRPDVTRRVFEAVAAAKPKRLFLIADGPRPNRPDEALLCEQVRKIVTAVDWPCQVETNFSEQNMGLRQRVVSGLNWVFSEVEDAIILEDDCLPSPSFFQFAEEMLDRYRNHPQISFVSGYNLLPAKFSLPYSYYFTLSGIIWGWATWRRAWQEFDGEMKDWPEIKRAGLLNNVFPTTKMAKYWTGIFDSMYDLTGPNSWAYRWFYTCWTRNWLSVLPAHNLIQNIGFGPEATHTSRAPIGFQIHEQSMDFPLIHPPAITPWPEHTREFHEHFFEPGIPTRVQRKLQAIWANKITRHNGSSS